MNFLTQKRRKILLGESQKETPQSNPFNNFYYKEVAKLTGAGGWCINFLEKKSYLDPEARKILKTPEGYVPSIRNAIDFYDPEHQELAAKTFYDCGNGKPFSIVVKMRTHGGSPFWAKAIGAPIYNENEEIIGIQGVFQDVNEQKVKELNLEKSLRIIESQNSRMLNFANIVSHNLRSHASNLNLTMELFKDAQPEETAELKENLFSISESLNATITHLNEIVCAQNKSIKEKKVVYFSEVLKSVMASLSIRLHENEVELYSEFSEVPKIEYIPFYLESIFMNLISNAIKYRSPERKLAIDIFTFLENDRPCLTIKDNGLGIDLAKHGKYLFNIYQTFHNTEDAVGIGLFIVKNQVETLQGIIEVESTVGVGTSFTIKF
ncbi:MAG: PAS domain-containing sensor histidine kinase [Flavobacteriaceae bacterium]